MPGLKDVMDAVMADIHAARAAADLRATEMLQLYSDHPDLAAFPIPAFRFRQVEVEIPVFALELDGEQRDDKSGTAPDAPRSARPGPAAMIESSGRALALMAERDAGISVSAKAQSKYRKDMDQRMAEQDAPADPDCAFAKLAARRFVAALPGSARAIAEKATDDWARQLEARLRDEFVVPEAIVAPARGMVVSLQKRGEKAPDAASDMARSVIRLTIDEETYRVEEVASREPGVMRKVLVRD